MKKDMREFLIKFMKFRDNVHFGENEFTENEDIIELFLKNDESMYYDVSLAKKTFFIDMSFIPEDELQEYVTKMRGQFLINETNTSELKLKHRLLFSEISEGLKVIDSDGDIGIVIDCDDKHNVIVEFDDEGKGMYYMDEECLEYEFAELYKY